MSILRTVKQQYENVLAVYKGALESQRLSVTTKLNAKATDVVRGSLVSLNADGEFILGLPEGSGVIYPMPMFSKKNAYDPDVTTGVQSGNGEIIANSTVGGTITAYVATGAFELETSEFDAAATYQYNQALVGQVVEGKQTGKLTPATKAIYGDTTVVGIVSETPYRGKDSMNVYGKTKNRLRFWPVFFPPTRTQE